MRRQALGRRGEAAARRFLEERGYRIVQANWRCTLGEVDLIAEEGGDLVFIEVKTRASAGCGTPAEAVDRRKLERLRRVTEAYLAGEGCDRAVRLDIVTVTVAGDRQDIEVIRGAGE